MAVITGAGSGIGEATAKLFAREGASLVLVDRAEGVHAVAASLGSSAIAVLADAACDADVRGFTTLAVNHFGGLDVMFANAGVSGRRTGLLDLSEEDWTETLRVNLIGPFLAIKHSAPKIVERGGGSIICTASVAGLRSGAGGAAYSASKAGVINLVQVSAQQLSGSGVRVNAICPGLIETGMTRAALFEPVRAAGKGDRIGKLNPLRRGGEASEIASAALFLASEEASYVNGHALVVDGGLASSHPVSRQEFGRVAL